MTAGQAALQTEEKKAQIGEMTVSQQGFRKSDELSQTCLKIFLGRSCVFISKEKTVDQILIPRPVFSLL